MYATRFRWTGLFASLSQCIRSTLCQKAAATRTLPTHPTLMKKLCPALLWLPLCLIGLVSSPLPALGQASLISTGAVWKYLDTGADLTATNWTAATFDDSAWLSGRAELGYGDTPAPDNRPEATVLSFGPDANNKYITY